MVQICDFPGSMTIGKPADWVEELDGTCGSIHVTMVMDVQTGLPHIHSIYKFSDEELAALNAGGLFRLTIVGKSHPVFQMAVLSPELAEKIDAKPSWDLGPVIGG